MIYYIISFIIFAALIIWAYRTPAGKAYKQWRVEKFGYWDTVILACILIGFNIWIFSVFGGIGLIFPFVLFFDLVLLGAIITSIIRIRKYKK